MADTESIDGIGNVIVGVSLIVMGGLLAAGTLGVAFVGELAAIAMLVTGLMMMRGLFGDNATVGTMLAVLGPAAILVPPFVPVIWWVAPLIGAFFAVAGIAKLPGLW